MSTQNTGKFFIGSLITFAVVFFLVKLILALSVSAGENTLPPESMAEADIVERIKPVAEATVGEAPLAEEVATSETKPEDSPATNADGEYIVKMLNSGADGSMVFEPAFLNVEKGSTIRFIPTDASHDSTSILTPEGADDWQGENSKELVVTLDVEGVYLYKCTPHAMMGMVGVIQVGEATNKAEAEKVATDFSASMMMGKDRFSTYMEKVGAAKSSAVTEGEEDTAEASEPAADSEVETAVATETANTEVKEYTVKMLNSGKEGPMVFEPAFLHVEKGATIRFIPTDASHDSTSVFTPEGADDWQGENSKEVVVTLDVEGVYLYKCTPHAMMGMVGVIQVGEATNKADAEKAAEKLIGTMAMGKDRLDNYLAEIK